MKTLTPEVANEIKDELASIPEKYQKDFNSTHMKDKDIKFAVTFPKYHPRAGEPTNFVEKIWAAVLSTRTINLLEHQHEILDQLTDSYWLKDWTPKRTTIRAGHRWKKGDMFVPKIWTGIPYRSKPIAICEPLEVLETHEFVIDEHGMWFGLTHWSLLPSQIEVVMDDGFDNEADFIAWFNVKKGQTFDGQRIRFA